MSIEIHKKNDWIYIPAPGRMDAFNFEIAKTEIEQAAGQARQLALDVSGAHFISIPMIKFIDSLAREMVRRGGRLALIGPTEKLKRQFRIFASLDPITLMTQDNWERLVNTSLEGNA